MLKLILLLSGLGYQPVEQRSRSWTRMHVMMPYRASTVFCGVKLQLWMDVEMCSWWILSCLRKRARRQRRQFP